MDPALNPYSPGAGRKPAALVGRDDHLRAWSVMCQRTTLGKDSQPIALYGLRGVGKTVLLGRMADTAKAKRFTVAHIEATSGRTLAESLSSSLYRPLAELRTTSTADKVLQAIKTALSFKATYDMAGTWSLGMDLDLDGAPGGAADSGVLDRDLSAVLQDVAEGAHKATGTGLALLVDEAQEVEPQEMSALCIAAQSAATKNWPIVIALAGLPSLLARLGEAKSYAERQFGYRPIGALDTPDAQDALTKPAASEGVQWDADAVQYVAAQSEGYPYFLQQYGQDAWDRAPGPHICLEDARVGVAAGRASLDAGFYYSRWSRATAAERDYMRAISAVGSSATTAEVSASLGKERTSLGPIRARLLDKGLLYAPDHGVIAFTVPGMDKYIKRHHDDSE